MFKGESRKDGGWRDSSAKEQRLPGTGGGEGYQESRCSVLRDAGGGWLGAAAASGAPGHVLCCSIYCRPSSGCFFHPFSEDGGGVRQHQGHRPSDPNFCCPRDPGQAQSCPPPGLPGIGKHPGFLVGQSQPCSSLAVWPWAGLLPSLNPSFPTCE